MRSQRIEWRGWFNRRIGAPVRLWNLRKSGHSFLARQHNAGKWVYILEALSKEKKRAGRKCRLSTHFQSYFRYPAARSNRSSSISRLYFDSGKPHLKILARILIENLLPPIVSSPDTRNNRRRRDLVATPFRRVREKRFYGDEKRGLARRAIKK